MSEGFFRNSEISSMKRRPLPPRLISCPVVGKTNKETKYEGLDEFQHVMDIECNPNYFLVKFMRVIDRAVEGFEQVDQFNEKLNRAAIQDYIDCNEIITFNGNVYDILMLQLALAGATNAELWEATQDLIVNKMRSREFREKWGLPDHFPIDHIDLEPVAIGVKISLKLYGGRLHCDLMQDLPYPPGTVLTEEQMDKTNQYCDRDLDKTRLMFLDLLPQINLRRTLSAQYKIDLRSKSDAQIAESVITSELTKMLPRGSKLQSREVEACSFRYKAPDFIGFRTPVFQKALDIITTERFMIESNGTIKMPEELKALTVQLGSSTYNMGMGGLHSTEKIAFHVADKSFSLWDWDVTSYYPEIIRRLGLYPRQLGPNFLPVYCGIIDERVRAKAAKDKVKADCFKIIVNGSFGKLGSPYSMLYAPELLIQVTVTGQLSLLMLIEMMENKGISVVSGNTDGIVIKCPTGKEDVMKLIIKRWEALTGFTMEHTNYLGLWSRDVNNYIAVKTDGEVKRKGTYKAADIGKNPEHEICAEAMIEYLRYGTPIEDTIRNCKDIRKFVTVRSVTGGAVKQYNNGEIIYLGKAVRWYYSTIENGPITYLANGKQVPITEDCKPIMDITVSFPRDMDYLWYINKAKELFS